MPASTAPSVRRLRSTARAMLPFPEPESWLDVETGDADFPEAARTLFPYTAFDGLDPTPRVVYAQAAERLEEAHLGRLTDPRITTRLRARYDVVSLLNQSPGPEGLRAALAVLRPGGHLLVETPDDPRAELESQGCTIVTTARRSAHVPPRVATRLTRALPPRASGPLIPTARALDHTLALLLAGTRHAKTYRVIARKNADTGTSTDTTHADTADAGIADAGSADAGSADADAGTADAGAAVAGPAGVPDTGTGTTHAGTADADSLDVDTGTAVAGPAEVPDTSTGTGTTHAGTADAADAGSADADTGAADTGTADTGAAVAGPAEAPGVDVSAP